MSARPTVGPSEMPANFMKSGTAWKADHPAAVVFKTVSILWLRMTILTQLFFAMCLCSPIPLYV